MVEKAYELIISVDKSLDKDEAIAQASNYIPFEVDILGVDAMEYDWAEWSVSITIVVDDQVVGENDLYWSEHVDTVKEVSIADSRA